MLNEKKFPSLVPDGVNFRTWYELWIEEAKAILTEFRFNSTLLVIEGKWELGNHVFENELNFSRAGYGKKMIEKIACDLKMSQSALYSCLQFAQKFPKNEFKEFSNVLDKLPDGKAVTWRRIIQKVLPAPKGEIKECDHEWENYLKCRLCGQLKKKKNK